MPFAPVYKPTAVVPQRHKRASPPWRETMCLAVGSVLSYGAPPLLITVAQMQIAHLFREGRLTNRPMACST